MNYGKPEITVNPSALREIQGMSKPPFIELDSNQSGQYSTLAA